jgi:hypothetical protein
MIRIGIELNDVVRNVNKQILKYYQKDIDPTLDLDDIDDKDDVFKYAKFDSNRAKNEFIYIDYPYEIFGCAKTMTKELATEFTNWLSELTNYEDDNVEIYFYSLGEESLTIQSTYFFLSKIGTRVRKVVFPRDLGELRKDTDVIVTASKKTVDYFKDDKDIYKILINNKINSECKEDVDTSYDTLSEVIKDKELLDTLHKFVTDKIDRNTLKGGYEN